jgi:hypothetical protein
MPMTAPAQASSLAVTVEPPLIGIVDAVFWLVAVSPTFPVDFISDVGTEVVKGMTWVEVITCPFF